jgi:DNA-binding transcriptional LysR family regulator
VTAHETAAIGRRAAEIGIHSGRPTEANLAARQIGRVAYALYCLPKLVGGVAAALFVGITGEGGNSPSARWLMAHHGDRIAVRGNDPASVRELVAAGAGLSVFPCFVGDSDARLARVAPPIPELVAEQWLVVHQDERHTPAVRIVRDRLAMLMKRSAPLFRGDLGNHV